ncbi:imelysin family protein [Flagellimonas sp. HMM57]|uniref:imelysin family protein n=1 Tax=unclassified Flagellimonas TaxID=2644544 RepID=UPI0013D5E0E3|nr:MULTISPECIES: imelysin family protein [unclassified Flagellimonas]UII75149.1 imelysin family protein [Flagellimonas sp. HMM57]
MKKYWYFLFAVPFLIWACSSDSNNDDGTAVDDEVPVTFDRSAMLVNWADNIIVPAYQSFSAKLIVLEESYDSFVSDRSVDNLTAFREAWLDAYTAWQQVSLFETGPAESVGYRLNMNTYPADADLIESHIANGAYDLSLPSNRDAKGFPALDYLLNGLETDDVALVNRLASGTEADGTLSYMDDVISDMKSLTDDVVGQWEGDYRDTFVENDGSSSTASVDRFVNDYIFYYEKFLRAGKMGIPLGVFTGETAPNTIEAFYKADISNTLFLEGLSAVQDFFNGKHFNSSATGESLASYLEDLNSIKDGDDLSELINNQLNTARTAVSGLDTFRNEIENNDIPTNMNMAYDEVQRAVPLLKVDMVSAMSISIDFVDADGD